jgi:MSHA biogenesis protein MshI
LGDGTFELLAVGSERQAADERSVFVKGLQALGLKGAQATIMLRTEQYQFLQIDTPVVPPEELRAAARYQVRDMLQTHVDDVTIDVIRVGDGQHKGAGHSFVVAATNSVVKEVMDLAGALNCQVSVIDIQETAQRNLQTALTRRDGTLAQANAALILDDAQQALLTISANEELFYTRRFDLPEGFLTGVWGQDIDVLAPVDGFTPVEEYMPSYSTGDVMFGDDYRSPQATPVSATRQDDDRAQRLVVEIQRSLDVWDRTWSSLSLSGLRVFAGARSAELAQWLTRQLGAPVIPMEVASIFSGFDAASPADQRLCLPLLGVLLRNEAAAS